VDGKRKKIIFQKDVAKRKKAITFALPKRKRGLKNGRLFRG
jgi:hypothetical protein